jgi:hypothetical protein
MNATIRKYTRVLLVFVALSSSAYAAAVTVSVSSSDTAAWALSAGGTGVSVPNGGPAIWNSRFSATIPPGSTNIRFTLNSFEADDKGVIQLNGGSPIADDTTGTSNGGAAGAGTFDFGLGGGNAPYTFVGFTPGTSSSLPDGTTNFSLLVSINDTGVTNPSAPPLSQAFISDFRLSGTLDYDEAIAPPPQVTPTPVPVMPVLMLVIMGAFVSYIGLRRLKTKY